MMVRLFLILGFPFLILGANACKHKPQYPIEPVDSNALYGRFPSEIGKIIINKCATAGCHNAESYKNAAGLLLDSWDHLFDGGVSGAVVIPYSPENSSFLFFINPDSSLGAKAQPQMPLNATPLSKDEYLAIKDWIEKGAPDKDGNMPFASNVETRQKIYLTNQGCDLIGVIDAEKKVLMRYIKVGKDNGIEVPHCVRVASDGYAYVSFTAGRFLQKIDTRTDKVVADLDIGSGSWNVFYLSQDGKKLLLGDFSGNGLVLINTENMQVEKKIYGVGMSSPHGITSNRSFDTFYVTSQYGNTVYKLSFKSNFFFKKISIDSNPPVNLSSRNPHEIFMAPDYSKYFLTCDNSNEVRVMDAHADTLIDSIQVGIYPQEMTMSRTKPYLFVTCSEDNSTLTGFKGSVYVVNYNTHEIVQRIDGPFYQPHAISIDDANGLIYVANRNVNATGPAPHHSSSCGGRNGYYSVYNLNTFQKLPKRYEVSVDPYSSDIRFK